MNRLSNIALTAASGTGVQFREETYGNHGIQSFLRDVLAMANASVEGDRYIVTGVGFDEDNQPYPTERTYWYDDPLVVPLEEPRCH